MPTDPVFRAARAVVFATVCVGLAITGHVMASHGSVPPMAAVVGFAAMTATGAVLGGTERSLATILIGLLGGQFMLHALFTAAENGQHAMHARPMAPASGGFTMTAAHVVAAIVSAWWLRRGERAVWGLTRRLAAAVLRPVRTLLPAPLPLAFGSCRPAEAGSLVRCRDVFLRHVVVRRGPPSPSTLT